MSRRRLTTRVVCLASLNVFLIATGALPQATVHGLARGTQPLEETTGVQLKRIDSSTEPVVRVGMELHPGDRLSSGGDRVDVELQCPGGSVLRFTGSYRVFIDEPGDGVDCAVNFLSGTVDVLTDKPTEIESGGVTLGSEGTQYSVSVSYRDRQPDVGCQVYDGRVEWRFSKKAEWLSAGNRLQIFDTKADVAKIGAELDRLGIAREFHAYDGAGHAFQNFVNPDGYRAKASLDAWDKLVAWLGKTL